MSITTWKDWTKDTAFRKTYWQGNAYITLTPEVRESIRSIVSDWTDARAVYHAEKAELRRLVREGVITNDLDVRKWFDGTKIKQLELIKQKADDDFTKSLRDLSPKDRANKIAVRNCVRAVYAKATEKIRQEEQHWNDAREIQSLAEALFK